MSDDEEVGEIVKPERVFIYPENFLDPDLPKGVLSPSGIMMYRRCPRQFEYAYIKEMVRRPSVAMIKGTAIHKGAEDIHNHTIQHSTLMTYEQVKDSVVDAVDKNSKEFEAADWTEAGLTPGALKDASLQGIYEYYTKAVPLIEPVAVEKTYAFNVGTVPVRCVIDLLDKAGRPIENTTNTVVDLKTTAKMWSQQKLDYDVQLDFYAIAEKTNKLRFDFLIPRKVGVEYIRKEVFRTRSEINILIEDVEEIAMWIKKGVFPRCDPTGWNCTPKFCGFYGLCRK